MKALDIATIVGLVVCLSLCVYGIVGGDQGWPAIMNFLDPPSAFITFGGAFCCVLASTSIKNFVSGFKSFAMVLKVPAVNIPTMIQSVIDLSNIARKDGLLSLEEATANLDDPFLKKGILLIVDGTDPELVRAIMETELSSIEKRHASNIKFWDDLGTMGPAWGMIGTLLGLVNMLKQLDDAAAIGPNMAVALITTLYGSLLANWICMPVATKLKVNSQFEIMAKEIMVEGILSIQAGENPRVIEDKLKSFLSPKERVATTSDEGGAENG